MYYFILWVYFVSSLSDTTHSIIYYIVLWRAWWVYKIITDGKLKIEPTPIHLWELSKSRRQEWLYPVGRSSISSEDSWSVHPDHFWSCFSFFRPSKWLLVYWSLEHSVYWFSSHNHSILCSIKKTFNFIFFRTIFYFLHCLETAERHTFEFFYCNKVMMLLLFFFFLSFFP